MEKTPQEIRLENLKEIEYDSTCEHPTARQLFALEGMKCLTPKQRAIWEYDKFDKLTHQQIADKIGISRPVVSKHLKAATNRMSKWFIAHQQVYNLFKNIEDKQCD